MPIHADEQLLRSHPSASTSHQSSPAKPSASTTTRLLILLLQALVMSVSIVLFFLFAGIATIILIHLLIAGRSIRRLRRDRYRYLHSSPNEDRPRKDGPRSGLSLSELKRIPIYKFTTNSNIATKLKWCSDCAVCLEGFREDDRFRMMPTCNHAFHKLCADKWLVRSPVCPICRADVCSADDTRCS